MKSTINKMDRDKMINNLIVSSIPMNNENMIAEIVNFITEVMRIGIKKVKIIKENQCSNIAKIC